MKFIFLRNKIGGRNLDRKTSRFIWKTLLVVSRVAKHITLGGCRERLRFRP
uniref:Uncharacterized protein n=1 Tax=Myoviridae sp. ctDvB7 TaxID=2825057 RepID=A0A8S5UEG1_9CAUD|nr:MAG TPA: hypothetical protein [Myoviridae sp. ctDvB7]